MSDFFDLQKQFYRPLWIRVLVVTFCLGWAIVELSQGAVFWALLFGGVGLYASHQFFIAFDPKPETPDDGKDPGNTL